MYDPYWKERTKVSTVLAGRFGRNMRELRVGAGLTQGDLARKIGILPGYVSQLESGARTPSLAMIEKVAEGLDVDPAMLLRKEDGG